MSEQQLLDAALARVRNIFKGNGVKMDSVNIASKEISTLSLNAGTYLELKPVINERQVVGKVVAGQYVPSREEARRQSEQTMATAAHDPAMKARIADSLLRRPDQGFGLNRQTIPIDFLKREYSWHEACEACRGSSQGVCTTCHGKRVEPCTKCSARGLMPCPLCRGIGLMNGDKCTRCQGQRYVPCDTCGKSGMMRCRTCGGIGMTKCAACSGAGSKSFIMNLSVQAATYFEYEAKTIPKFAADMIETQGASLVAAGKIKVQGRIADDKENVLGASYEATFPYGDLVFAAGKNEVKASLFGYKGDLVNFPYILDKIVAPAMNDLEEAARDVGDVATKIKRASRYRLIALALLTASRTSAQKTAAHLLKTYDIGLSLATAEKIAFLADEATSRITRKPRNYGLALGLLIAAGLNAAYYFTGLRGMIAGAVPVGKFDFVLDLPLPVIGGVVAASVIQTSAAGAIRKALGHLMPATGKGSVVPKTRSSGLWGYGGCVVITLATILLAARTGASTPYWVGLVRSILGLS